MICVTYLIFVSSQQYRYKGLFTLNLKWSSPGVTFGIPERYSIWGPLESMKNSGLEVGDIVFIESKNSYNVGDIIAFYRTPSNYEKDPSEVEDLDKKQIKNNHHLMKKKRFRLLAKFQDKLYFVQK